MRAKLYAHSSGLDLRLTSDRWSSQPWKLGVEASVFEVEESGEVGHQCLKSRRAARWSTKAVTAMRLSQRLIRFNMKCKEGQPVSGVPKQPSR